jgi:hypothetical protein
MVTAASSRNSRRLGSAKHWKTWGNFTMNHWCRLRSWGLNIFRSVQWLKRRFNELLVGLFFGSFEGLKQCWNQPAGFVAATGFEWIRVDLIHKNEDNKFMVLCSVPLWDWTRDDNRLQKLGSNMFKQT